MMLRYLCVRPYRLWPAVKHMRIVLCDETQLRYCFMSHDVTMMNQLDSRVQLRLWITKFMTIHACTYIDRLIIDHTTIHNPTHPTHIDMSRHVHAFTYAWVQVWRMSVRNLQYKLTLPINEVCSLLSAWLFEMRIPSTYVCGRFV